jgi:transcriptional regulator with XRE-family HTH domain
MSHESLQDALRRARTAARLSQLALSLRLGVSQRHVSFVESGRALPSRALLNAWLEELQVPLAARNAALLAAGYAPSYSTAQLGDAALAIPTDAMQRLLHVHDPMPAWVVDAHWNVLHANRGGMWLVGTLLPALATASRGGPLNMLDLLTDPDGLCTKILNLDEVGQPILAQLRAESVAHPALVPKLDALRVGMQRRLGPKATSRDRTTQSMPVLTTRFATPYGVLSFFTMLTTFGTPHDITLASLRVEHLFAADAQTAAIVHAQVPAA